MARFSLWGSLRQRLDSITGPLIGKLSELGGIFQGWSCLGPLWTGNRILRKSLIWSLYQATFAHGCCCIHWKSSEVFLSFCVTFCLTRALCHLCCFCTSKENYAFCLETNWSVSIWELKKLTLHCQNLLHKFLFKLCGSWFWPAPWPMAAHQLFLF